uniref:Uncharacterized protein n=1 Tax=Rhizophora mucronata TaxID=61149 RepID=A0A2P2QFS0_RHIMU
MDFCNSMHSLSFCSRLLLIHTIFSSATE